VLAGAFAEVLIQIPALTRLTQGLRVNLDRTPEVREVLHRFGPVVLGRGVVQILGYVELLMASLLATGAVSALTYAQVLYLLPISLFGMAVAAAELPELARMGRQSHAEIRERLGVGLDRIAFYVAPIVALYLACGDVIVGALLQRGEFSRTDSRLVWYVVGTFSLGLLATTRSRLLQNGLYALDRQKLVARISVLRVGLAVLIGALFMFPLDRWVLVGSSVERMGDLGFGPLPDSLRLVTDGSPRLGVIGLALGAAISAWVEYAILRGVLMYRIGRLPRMSLAARWCIVASVAIGVLAAGIRSVSDDVTPLLALLVVCGPAGLTYLAITGSVGVPEARALLGRVPGLPRRA
jgi:putative peptidoglycan lipid II flippase